MPNSIIKVILKFKFVVMLLVFMSAGIDLSAITMRDDKKEALYSELANKFPGTVKVQVVHNWFGKNKHKHIGSGTLIAPQWILTADHNVMEGPFVVGETGVIVDNKFYPTDAIVRHPLAQSSEYAISMTNDLALLHLVKPLVSIKPVERYRGSNEKGKHCILVGYGLKGTGLKGQMKKSENIKRACENNIDAVSSESYLGNMKKFKENAGGDLIFTDFDFPKLNKKSKNWFGSNECLELEGGGTSGDSGGTLYIKQNESYVQVGVFSGTNFVKRRYGDVSRYVRVSKYNPWIDHVMALYSEQSQSKKIPNLTLKKTKNKQNETWYEISSDKANSFPLKIFLDLKGSAKYYSDYQIREKYNHSVILPGNSNTIKIVVEKNSKADFNTDKNVELNIKNHFLYKTATKIQVVKLK